MDARQTEYLTTTKKNFCGLFGRVFSGGVSRTMAIKAKCIDCVGQEDAINSIRGCGITTCPLFNFRPYVKRPKSKRGFGSKKAPEGEAL